MRDFPPVISTFYSAAGEKPGPAPDTRTPAALLRWFLRMQWRLILLTTTVGVLWQLPLTLGPWIFGKAIDDGIVPGSVDQTLKWAGLLLLVTLIGAFFGIVMHTLIVRGWLIALYGTMKMVTRKVAQMGHVLPRRTPTGEVLSVASADSDEFGALTEIVSRSGSQLISYLVVAFIVLSTSPELGVLMLLAAPVLVGAALPLLRPLHRKQQIERGRNSDLTSMATDIVAGLRILRGIGGERTFGRNYDRQSQLAREAGVGAGMWQAAIEAVGVLFSGVFIVLLVWLGSRQVISGDLEIGQLISFLGYALFMIYPIQTFFELAQKSTRAMVSARKAVAIFEEQPPWPDRAESTLLPHDADLYDELTGFVARHGQLTIVVCAVPEETSALADRLGRYLPADTEPVSQELEEGIKGRAARRARAQRLAERARLAALDEELANREWGVTPRRRRPRRGLARRRTPADPGQRHRQPALRRHAPGRHRPARPADARPGRGGRPRGQRRGRVRRAAGRLAGRARRAWSRAVGRSAPASRARAGARRRRADPGAGRAHLRGRRPHRGADRRAGRCRPAWADHRGEHRVARCGCTTPTAWCCSSTAG